MTDMTAVLSQIGSDTSDSYMSPVNLAKFRTKTFALNARDLSYGRTCTFCKQYAATRGGKVNFSRKTFKCKTCVEKS